MLKPNLLTANSAPFLFFSHGSLLSSHRSSPFRLRPATVKLQKIGKHDCIRCASGKVQSSSVDRDAPIGLRAVVAVKMTVGGLLSNLGPSRALDDTTDLFGKSLLLELLAAEVDPKTGQEKATIQAYAHKGSQDIDDIKYECDFTIPKSFGEIGAVLVTNEHHNEMFLKDITFSSDDTTTLTISCNSWVHSKSDNPEKRIFFTNKSYLPAQTPSGLRRSRSKELEIKRGDGQGERKDFERIYDYDVYNDLGDPDADEDKARPVLGGSKKYPYPRRCRTGRPRTQKDPLSETRSSSMYVPRDEAFSEVKSLQFSGKTLRSVLHAVIPSIQTALIESNLGFPYFTAIDKLYDEGLTLPKQEGLGLLQSIIPRLVKVISDGTDDVLKFEPPAMIEKDKFSWLRDEEFSRQTLAGVNPYAIQLVTEFPLKSKLDPQVYGPPESAINVEMIEEEIGGFMTVKEALKQKRLFMLDYHDLFLPFVHKVEELEGTTLYGSRTIFFLTNNGTLRPLAIELTRPASPLKPQWKQVFMPCWDATGAWLWKLAKAHVGAHDSGYHELITHWLRTHACVEPYIIAANRQLNAMHPIYRLLHPHFRYTMEINSLARQFLISAAGIIESSFSPLKYSMEISSVAYDQFWRFDMEALPADLIRRGMAVEDPIAEHGLRLTIEDYPFATDGLLIWSAIKQWIQDYVSHYYLDSSHVLEDYELQEFWNEVRTKGHGDKKDEPWWPKMDSPENLIHILTTITWVASAHHAAVNFGQYQYGGYFPNRPTIARIKMPVEDLQEDEFIKFLEKPEVALLRCFPSQIQATVVMAVLDVLSSHSPDEEYLGGEPELPWVHDPIIKAAYERFNGRLKEIEGIIDERNADPKLKNRFGAGTVPYESMKPFSEPGVTGMGIPNSISI
ncbi:probable lipoxygenase 8, chloroplastic [Phoenix dactylifera]|uniref:Lipoxygenase n=1 Tax=Phoenix dactylifera TaxID=42345 RepID=A0A8B7BJH0_PHODC|nr:probable lipoxygenase 8, chloroplastic [Phoenix dactylifera]